MLPEAVEFIDINAPPTRPSSALSGGSSYRNADSDVDSSDEEVEYIRPRVRDSTIRRHGDQCLVCDAKNDLEVYRVIFQHGQGLEVSGHLHRYYRPASLTPRFM